MSSLLRSIPCCENEVKNYKYELSEDAKTQVQED